MVTHLAIIVLTHLKGIFERLLNLQIEPVLNGRGYKLDRDKKYNHGGEERQTHKGQNQLGPQFCSHYPFAPLKEELYEISDRQEKQQEQEYYIEIYQGKDKDTA